MNPSEMEGDLKEWGERMEMNVKGLSALGYPSGQPDAPCGAGIPIPDYFPNHQIQALHGAIERLESKYKDILILKYVYKITDYEAAKQAGCHRSNVPNRIDKAKHLLVKSRYWKV